MARFHPKAIVFVSLILVLIAAVACGGAATATAVPATSTPAARGAPATSSPAAVAASPTPFIQAIPPTAVAIPTLEVQAAMVTSTTKRLIASIGRISLETNLPWARPNTDFDKRSMYENLIGVDRRTGELIPEIAKGWEVSPDGVTYTFFLRDDVPFHGGWGNVTSRDVKHMVRQIAEGEGARATETVPYRDTIANVEIISDTEVKIHQTKPDTFTVPFFNYGGHGASVLISKAKWDAEGIEGYRESPVGTGAYRYVSREPATKIVMERVEDHWRHTPEFEELEKRFIVEESTRLAAILADEIHFVGLPRDLRLTAVDRGMVEWNSVLPAVQSVLLLFGQYYESPELVGDEPWIGENENAIKVRRAMNKAINRKEINTEIFGGTGEEIHTYGFHSTLPGWNPDWDTNWEEQYGYDPVRAKELLAEAGYPEGFKVKVNLSPSSTWPEQVQVAEAVGLYFKAIGLDVEHTQIVGAEASNLRRNRKFAGYVYPIAGTYRDPQYVIRSYHDHVEGITRSYTNDWLRARYLELASEPNQDARSAKEREIGDYLYENFADLPMFWFPGSAVVNPDVISEYIFPGNRREIFTHMEWIKAANTR